MFGIGGAELFIILLFAFIVFGPDKMPEMGRTIGRAIRQFREAQEQMNKVVRSEVYDPDSDTDPFSAFFDKSDKKKPEGEKPASSSGTPDAVSGSEPTADESDSEIKMAAPAGETFAQKKARLAAEKRAAKAEREASTAEKLYGLDTSTGSAPEATPEATPEAPTSEPGKGGADA